MKMYQILKSQCTIICTFNVPNIVYLQENFGYVIVMYIKFMVLLSGIEPPTSPLPRECSTTELQQPDVGGA